MQRTTFLLILVAVIPTYSQVSSLPRFTSGWYTHPYSPMMDSVNGNTVNPRVQFAASAYGFPYKIKSSIALVDDRNSAMMPDSMRPSPCRGCTKPEPMQYFWSGQVNLVGLKSGRKTVRVISEDTSGWKDTISIDFYYNTPPLYILSMTDTVNPIDPTKDSIRFHLEVQDPEGSATDIGIRLSYDSIPWSYPPSNLRNLNKSIFDTTISVRSGFSAFYIAFQVWDSPGARTSLKVFRWPIAKSRPDFYRPYLRDTTAIEPVAAPGNGALQSAGPWAFYTKSNGSGGTEVVLERNGRIETAFSNPIGGLTLLFLTTDGELAYSDGQFLYLRKPDGNTTKISTAVPGKVFNLDGKWFLNHEEYSYVVDLTITPASSMKLQQSGKESSPRQLQLFNLLGRWQPSYLPLPRSDFP